MAALMGVLAMLAAGSAQAATITVTSLNDDTTTTYCDLREAINSAIADYLPAYGIITRGKARLRMGGGMVCSKRWLLSP